MHGSFKGAHIGLTEIFHLKNKNNAWLLTAMLVATFFITMYPKDLNDVFYYGTLLGYAFLIVIAIPFFVWLLSWVQKKLGRSQLQ